MTIPRKAFPLRFLATRDMTQTPLGKYPVWQERKTGAKPSVWFPQEHVQGWGWGSLRTGWYESCKWLWPQGWSLAVQHMALG